MIIGILMLVVFALVIIFVLANKKFNVLMNPCFVFVAEWTLIVALSNLGLFGLYKPSIETYAIILLGVVSFVGGYFILNRIKIRKKKKKQRSNFEVRYKLLYVLGAICIVYFAFSAVESLVNIINGNSSFNDIRASAQADEGPNGVLNFIYNFVVLPTTYVIGIITAADVFRGKRDKKLLIITITIIVLKVLSDGGRSMMLNFIIYLFMAYQLSKGLKKERPKLKRKVLLGVFAVAAVLVILFVVVTIQRSPSGVFRLSYLYSSMSPVLLDRWSKFINSSDGYQFGLICLNGILFAIGYAIKNLFSFAEYPAFIRKPYDMIANTDAQWVSINNNGTKANAYVTIFWFFYADFGFIGVIIGCLLYGLLVRKAFDYEKRKNDVRSLSFYLFIFWTLLYSFVRFQFAKSAAVIAMVLLYLSFRRIKKGEHDTGIAKERKIIDYTNESE